MALLLEIAPVPRDSGSGSIVTEIRNILDIKLLKFIGFAVLCVCFPSTLKNPLPVFSVAIGACVH